jgi:hypothetical protein
LTGEVKVMTPDNTQQIRLEAYYIWEREGRPEGRALEHWVAAEQLLGAEPAEALDGAIRAWLEEPAVPPAPQPTPAAAPTATRRGRKNPAAKPEGRPRRKGAAKDQPAT